MSNWFIFCRVIDNYGDIGVSWRLARQLVKEYPCQVFLWVDDISALSMIWPEVNVYLPQQVVAGVHVMHWHEKVDFSNIAIADVLIEAFACDAPALYIELLAQYTIKTGVMPKWANLEYLSAEQWVEEHHLLSSPQCNGLNKVFFFPGFTQKTGGLLRESGMKNDLDDAKVFYDDIPGSLKITLFGYESMPLFAWLPCLVNSNHIIQLAVTSGKATIAVQAACSALGISYAGEGALTIHYLSMLTQIEFDRLLQQSDLNFVRGEDSLVRALWAGKPLSWHIYPQDDGVHWMKLEAFISKYGEAMGLSLFQVFSDWQKSWNGDSSISIETSWFRFTEYLHDLSIIAFERMNYWQEQDDLVKQLWKWAH